MKEVRIRWGDMNKAQQNSIMILKKWLHQMWSNDDIRDYYSLHKWLSEIPNKNTLVSVQAQTTWMDENDVENYRDFFLSNYVYQIIQKIGEGDILYSTLIPVSITESTFEEYKSRYNKLYQYTMNYVYNPIKQFNTSI